MNLYTYKHRMTGRKVRTDKPLSSEEYVLVSRVRDMQMKGRKIIKKSH
jgi:hypothetical protein